MAHQTPKYPAQSVSESLTDNVMVDFPLSGLFGASRRDKDDIEDNDVIDSIAFTPTMVGARRPKSVEEMQRIIERLYSLLGDMSLVDILDNEIAHEKQRPMEMEMKKMKGRTPVVKLEDAVKLSAKAVQYWDEEWNPEGANAKLEFATMEKVASLMSDLTEGVDDRLTEAWDDMGRRSLHKARLWQQMGGFDGAGLYNECDEMEPPTGDGSSDARPIYYREEQEDMFWCSKPNCTETFDDVGRLREHLRQDHKIPRKPGNLAGKTLRQRVLESLTRGVGMGTQEENAEGSVGNSGGEVESGNGSDENMSPASSLQLTEGWFDLALAPDTLLLPVECSICSEMCPSANALRIHHEAEHKDNKLPRPGG